SGAASLLTKVVLAHFTRFLSTLYHIKLVKLKCSHKKDITYNQMYWYRQRPGETMTLIVYTAFGGQPDYGESPQSKYSAVKDSIETGALTVNDLQPDDGGLYFCAVSKHSDVRKSNS
uniref:Ig-like domain-containing protein n=1 Tax=Fundulus heteroclitus TaxID=8078 RepID=A0A3Q2UA40_FUNHE